MKYNLITGLGVLAPPILQLVLSNNVRVYVLKTYFCHQTFDY
jgi:hypothetical protein